jgi:hypothetical protein
MNVNEISKYNFPEITGTSQKTAVKSTETQTSEVKDRYQKGLDYQNVTYSSGSASAKKDPVLTQEEKNFFGKLYPNSSSEINTYQVYKNQSNSITGKLIDIKG